MRDEYDFKNLNPRKNPYTDRLKERMSFHYDRDERIAVFKDTLTLCKENERLRNSIRQSIISQKLIREVDNPGEVICGQLADMPENTGMPENDSDHGASVSASDADVNIVVSKKRSYEAARKYAGKRKVCVLNFASATNPGGGVWKGSSAQEECLCRCSTLYPCISEDAVRQGFHERHRAGLASGEMNVLYNDDCIYTPDVIVFKSDELRPRTLPESEWYQVNVITCAAPNLRSKLSNHMNPDAGNRAVRISDSDLMALHAKRANRILEIAKANGNEVVIMGAFGCGAFQNPPAVVAAGICQAVKQHRGDFQTIEFAVFCSARDTANYDAFRRVFGENV